MLIGGDLYNQFVDLTKSTKLSNGLILLHSFFGFVPFGSVTVFCKNFCICSWVSTDQNKDMKSDFSDLVDLSHLWSLKMMGIKFEYDKAVEQYRRIVQIIDKCVACSWPWRQLIC